jgi:hypothetical protein
MKLTLIQQAWRRKVIEGLYNTGERPYGVKPERLSWERIEGLYGKDKYTVLLTGHIHERGFAREHRSGSMKKLWDIAKHAAKNMLCRNIVFYEYDSCIGDMDPQEYPLWRDEPVPFFVSERMSTGGGES